MNDDGVHIFTWIFSDEEVTGRYRCTVGLEPCSSVVRSLMRAKGQVFRLVVRTGLRLIEVGPVANKQMNAGVIHIHHAQVS